MNYFSSHLKLFKISKGFIVFTLLVVILLIVTSLQINCPVCNDVVAGELSENLHALRIGSINDELIDYKQIHYWCLHSYIEMTWQVNGDYRRTA